ncbi:unnamed protein product [Parnassius mnemosyne]|uniref:DUF7041 domain-containing protein n=1 Tax=Parnassius mnemosyne TaxID=213953 RepID=A0AAV1L3G2_9NEOP
MSHSSTSRNAHKDNDSDEGKKTFTPSDICRIGVRPPPFWPEEPAVWFAQLEGNFLLSGIKDDATKFYYITSTLEQRYAAEVKDIIVSPPDKDKYEKLKTELIKRLSATREKEVKQLLMHEELGDRRPSQFLRHLQHLAGPSVPDDFLKTIWCSRLPHSIQTVIASQTTSDLQALADLADRVHDIVPSTPQVAAAERTQSSVLQTMANQICELTKQVQALSTRVHRPRSLNRNTRRARKTSRSRSDYRKFPTCWYHHKFGNKADRCIKPCDFKPENCQGGR